MKEHYVDNPEYLKGQYANADNLNVRIRLHERFSTNKQGLQPWLFDQMAIAPGMCWSSVMARWARALLNERATWAQWSR
jgi:hypothetical protein